ncbi:MAG: hypothetical protein DWI00_06410 [Planctomycetota bacterium]|nr:MAG: hypothetical protein DWI00_06410 [Planctomycetota bacterium]
MPLSAIEPASGKAFDRAALVRVSSMPGTPEKPALATAEIPDSWGKATARGAYPGFVSAS